MEMSKIILPTISGSLFSFLNYFSSCVIINLSPIFILGECNIHLDGLSKSLNTWFFELLPSDDFVLQLFTPVIGTGHNLHFMQPLSTLTTTSNHLLVTFQVLLSSTLHSKTLGPTRTSIHWFCHLFHCLPCPDVLFPSHLTQLKFLSAVAPFSLVLLARQNHDPS